MMRVQLFIVLNSNNNFISMILNCRKFSDELSGFFIGDPEDDVHQRQLRKSIKARDRPKIFSK